MRRGTRVRPRTAVAVLVGLLAVAVPVAAGAPAQATGVRFLDPVFASADVTSDLVYGQAVDYQGTLIDLRLDIYQPTGDTMANRPLVVWIHGGSFAYGDKTDAMDVDIATKLATRGYVVASINYRINPDLPLSGGAGGVMNDPTMLASIGNAFDDAKAAITWMRQHAADYAVDPEKIIAAGASAGAVTSENVGFMPNRAQGKGTPSDPAHVNMVLSVAGETLPGFVEPGEPPVFMAHGDQDTTVPYADDVAVCNWAKYWKVLCQMNTYPTDHMGMVAYLDDVLQRGSQFMYDNLIYPRPIVGKLTANSGYAAGGASVKITGLHLTGSTAVKFGTTAASFTVDSDTQITAVAPPHAAALVNVYVTNPFGVSANTSSSWFRYLSSGPPMVNQTAPNSGPAAGGTTVTISGAGFTGTTAVRFGTTDATTFTVNSDTSITATAPAHGTGLTNVYVETPLGISATSWSTWYRFT